MPAYGFSLILKHGEFADADVDALFEAGCDDGTPGTIAGVPSIEFTREGESLLPAIRSAIADVERAGFIVARVEIEADAITE